jgi:glycosyltransferase involved in cell wall biosynthesis
VKPDSLLLDVSVPFRIEGGKVWVESQAHHGLERWLDNFSSITLCAPTIAPELIDDSTVWAEVDDLVSTGRLTLQCFPWAYDAGAHMRRAGAVRAKLRALIPEHRYLCFGNIGWLGAWGRIGAEEAHKARRPFAIWADWVLHQMPRRQASDPLKWCWFALQQRMSERLSLRDIRRASLGLYNGRTVFDAYAPISRAPKLVHDIHVPASDAITPEQLSARLTEHNRPFRIIYVGRVHQMKGPSNWLRVMQRVIAQWRGTRQIHATWLGDGPLRAELQRQTEASGLGGKLVFPGAEKDHKKILQHLKQADLFVFCHLTPESPRCLIEALMSGLPIVGFESAYALDLLEGNPGGKFVPVGADAELADQIISILGNGQELTRMTQAARQAGSVFSDVAAFRQRSDFIKA